MLSYGKATEENDLYSHNQDEITKKSLPKRAQRNLLNETAVMLLPWHFMKRRPLWRIQIFPMNKYRELFQPEIKVPIWKIHQNKEF